MGSLDSWVGGIPDGWKDTLQDMLMGLLGIPQELNHILDQVVDMESSQLHHKSDGFVGILVEEVGNLVGE